MLQTSAVKRGCPLHRMKRSGMRWRVQIGQAVLNCPKLEKSGLFRCTQAKLTAARDVVANAACYLQQTGRNFLPNEHCTP